MIADPDPIIPPTIFKDDMHVVAPFNFVIPETFKLEMDKLSKNLTSLNGVYGNMLSAMTVKG